MSATYRIRPEKIKIATGRTARDKRPRVDYADRLGGLLSSAGFEGWQREYRFAAYAVGGPGKGLRDRLKAAGLHDWRFDAANIDLKVAIEIDGGNFMAGTNPITGQAVAVGRHTQAGDYRKRNAAARLGWRILSYTPEMLQRGEWISDVEAVTWNATKPR